MGRVGHVMEWAAKAGTRQIGIRWGESFPMYYVSEFPKSGGTWVARMVADYLQLPFTQFSRLPVAMPAVIQNHWTYHPRLKRTLFLYRDGRDVLNSYFFDRMRVIYHSDRPGAARMKKTYARVFPPSYDPKDIKGLLPRFLEWEFAHPGRGARLNWGDYIRNWYDPDNRPNIAYLSYEQLREDCAGTLARAVHHVAGGEPDEWRLNTTVEKFSMARATGRKPGQEDKTAHIRKGVVGDWVNNFTRESAQMFNDLAGDALVTLGYEQDRNWVDRYEYSA